MYRCSVVTDEKRFSTINCVIIIDAQQPHPSRADANVLMQFWSNEQMHYVQST